MTDIGIAASYLIDNQGRRLAAVGIQHNDYELNLLFLPREWDKLDCTLPFCLDAPAVIAGTCSGKPIRWSRDKHDRTFVVLGEDDKNWGVGFRMPTGFLTELLAEIRREFPDG